MKVSRFLSYVLRHEPASIGLSLDSEGWAELDELIKCSVRHGKKLDRRTILNVIANSDKQRFSIDESGTRIRANQGHSIPVDLGLKPRQPLDCLFHGTAARFIDSILQRGLHAQSRQHVHLSSDKTTANDVGRRHGKPVVLVVDAPAMAEAGHEFYVSDNGVWLVAEVPPQYLSVLDEGEFGR